MKEIGDEPGGENWHRSIPTNSQAASDGSGGGGGSIAERRAARTGFNTGGFRISTARFRQTGSPICSPGGARSPYITIPAGLSPTALLDSPIMLPNSPVDPSPTTGTLFSSPYSHGIMLDTMAAPIGGERESDDSTLFNFQRFLGPTFVAGISASERNREEEAQLGFSKILVTNGGHMNQPDEENVSITLITDMNYLSSHPQRSDKTSDTMPQHQEHTQIVKEELGSPLEGEQNGTYSPIIFSQNSEDGYNWRKYGQKYVKGSEFPRSYYKCTHQTCLVRKIVERAPDGQVTEIIYKGKHNHQKPQLNRRSITGVTVPCKNETFETSEGNRFKSEVGSTTVRRNIQTGFKDSNLCSPLRDNCLSSIRTDISNPLSTTRLKAIGVSELAGTPGHSFTFSSHDVGATQGNISLGDDITEDKSDAKKRKTEVFLVEANVSLRSAREPKVVVEIESEIDVLEDGYRWRKYGQKVVKGNPNPRSYYKCTSIGCRVRKHVERACHNIKFVITTYEGKHNHDVPAARNSYPNFYGGGLPSKVAASSQPTLSRNAETVSKPNSPVNDSRLHFEGKVELGNAFTTRSCLPSDMKFGAATSMSQQMAFRPSQNSMAYGNFLLNPTYNVLNQPLSAVAPHFGMSSSSSSLSSTFPRSIRRIPGGFNHNNKSFLGGQPFFNNDAWSLKPKEEQSDDNLFNTHFPSSADHLTIFASSCSSSST